MPVKRASVDANDSRMQSREGHAYVHTLSLRLTGDQYRQLRRFVIGHEERTDQRITHQAVLEAALGITWTDKTHNRRSR